MESAARAPARHEGVTVRRIAAVDVLRGVDGVADGLVRLAAAMIEAQARFTAP